MAACVLVGVLVLKLYSSDREVELLATGSAEPAATVTRPRDDYLIALAESSASILVSGDQDILALSKSRPIDFEARLGG